MFLKNYRIRNYLYCLMGFASLFLLSSCAPKVTYQDIEDNDAGIIFTVADQRKLVNQLAESLTNDADLGRDLGTNKPTLLIDVIKNKTNEHIDTESITDTLRVKTIRSRMFTIVNRDKIDVLKKESALVDAGLGDKERATNLGKIWGAKYVLYGNFSSIVNYVGKSKQVYYKLTLTIQDIETGTEIWVDEAEINKQMK